MPLEYEDDYVPKEHFLEMHRLKTPEFLKEIIGKTIKDIKYPDGYSCVLIIFTDETELEINAEDCFDFDVSIIPGKE